MGDTDFDSTSDDEVPYSDCLVQVVNDPRLEYLSTYTLTTFRVKNDKWTKMMSTNEFRSMVLEWLNNPNRRILVMMLSPGEYLIPKNSMTDLYHNYAIHPSTSTAIGATSGTTGIGASAVDSEMPPPDEADAEETAEDAGQTSGAIPTTVISTSGGAATALLVPLPPPSSSFSTLDGVPRGKCVYFMRRQLGAQLTKSNMHKQVIHGDLPVHSKIETLATLFDEVFRPLLENPSNRDMWPDILCKDLQARMKEVQNTVSEIKGKTNNRTILSLLVSPKLVDEVAKDVRKGKLESAIEPKFRNLLEEMFINWITQIHEILRQHSECVPLGGSLQSASLGSSTSSSSIGNAVGVVFPVHEITYWTNRQTNLENIYAQLRSHTHKALVKILEDIDSAYIGSFKKVFKELVYAWKEAEDITLWLQPLLRHTSAFNAINFINAQDLIEPLVHVVHLIWTNATHYRSTKRMSVLLRTIGNFLVHRATEDLEMSTLFHNDADEGLIKINKAMEIITFFKEKLMQYKEKYASNQEILPALPVAVQANDPNLQIPTTSANISTDMNQVWRFSNELIFDHSVNGFLRQLEDMQKIFEAAVSFQNLERFEIGGFRGKLLTERIRQLYDEFKVLFEAWTTVELNFTTSVSQGDQNSFHWTRLKQRQHSFFDSIKVLEKKLATILIQALMDCHNWEMLMKFTTMFGCLLHRHNILNELQITLRHIVSIFTEELQLLEDNVQQVLIDFEYQGLDAIPIKRNFPPIAGAMMWLDQHIRRCDAFGFPDLNEFIKAMLPKNPQQSMQYADLSSRYKVLITKLSNVQLKLWQNWQQSIETRITDGFNSRVMFRSATSGANGQEITSSSSAAPASATTTDDTTPSQGTTTRKFDVRKQFKAVRAIAAAVRLNLTKAASDEDKTLEVNFSNELFVLLKEAKYLLSLHYANSFRDNGIGTVFGGGDTEDEAAASDGDSEKSTGGEENFPLCAYKPLANKNNSQLSIERLFPECLRDLYAKRDEFWLRKVKLIKIEEFYNGIRSDLLSRREMQLIRVEVNEIDSCVETAINSMTWRLYDPELVDEIYETSQRLYLRLQQTHNNLQAICASIRRWSAEPLHQRSLYGKNLLELRHQQERLQNRLMQIEETKMLLNRLLIANFCLFFNYDENNFEIYARDLSVQEFLQEFPGNQRRKYHNYLVSVDELICKEVRQAMKISLEYLHFEMNTSETDRVFDGPTKQNSVSSSTGVISPTGQSTAFAGVSRDGSLQMQSSITSSSPASSAKGYRRQRLPSTLSTALFEVRLVLIETIEEDGLGFTEIRFEPSFDTKEEDNFQQIVEQLLVDINQTSNCLPRIVGKNGLSDGDDDNDDDDDDDDNDDDDDDDKDDDDDDDDDDTDNGEAHMDFSQNKSNQNQIQNQIIEKSENSNDNDDDENNDNDDVDDDKPTGAEVDNDKGAPAIQNNEALKTCTDAPTISENTVTFKVKEWVQKSKGKCKEFLKPENTDSSLPAPNKASHQNPSADKLDDSKVDELQELNDNIRSALNDTITAAKTYANQFNEYSYLWTQRQEDVLAGSMDMVKESATVSRGYALIEIFKKQIDRYNELHEDIYQLDSRHCVNGWLAIDVDPLKYALLNLTCKWANSYKRWLLQYVQQTLKKLTNFIELSLTILELPVAKDDFKVLLQVLFVMAQITQNAPYADHIFKPLKDIVALLKTYNVDFDPQLAKDIDRLPMHWKYLKDVAAAKAIALRLRKQYQQERVSAKIIIFGCQMKMYTRKFTNMNFFRVPCPKVYVLCDKIYVRLTSYTDYGKKLARWAELLDIEFPYADALQVCVAELKRIKQVWDFVRVIESCIAEWQSTPWQQIDADDMENECKKFTRDLRTLDKSIRDWTPYLYIIGVLKDLVASLRSITELQNPAITERHWLELMTITKLTRKHKTEYLLSFKCNPKTTLKQLLGLNLHRHEEEIKNAVDRAIKEMTVMRILDEIKATWSSMKFEKEQHLQRENIQILRVSEELIDTLDDNQMQLQNIATSKHIEYLIDKLTYWQDILSKVDALINSWFEVQRKWVYLENIFIGSPDIRAQLPKDTEQFESIDAEFTALLSEVAEICVVMNVVLKHGHIFNTLAELQARLAVCEKALNDYLETKRLAFPRFYFISSADLLDILSNGNNPKVIDRHFIKLFDSILRLEYRPNSCEAIGMHSKENDEYVAFTAGPPKTDTFIVCSGRVEIWLNGVIMQMRRTLHELFRRSLQVFAEKPREEWLYDWPAQVALCCNQISWTSDVNRAFGWIEEGYETAMKDLHKRQITQLNALINLLLGDLTPGDRQKIMTICTIDVHSRDVVGRIILAKIDNSLAFQWQSQLRHRWDDAMLMSIGQPSVAYADADEDCFANICDAEFRYAYEYLGNTSRLVITPLTDRCYITLTQSLHLVMGGAPAGPAGTGKTETTKDLGRALGVMVYVFNCSEQMDYKSCGNIYKGLAQTGAWGCFDEFNRISVEVLSVVAVQVKTIQEAIKMHKSQFVFMGETISLVPSVGIFITMNPGYAGRTELPENLKTLFRPCAMIVPDFALICEIMLMAEGFQEAKLLARKFITLYTLCKELLSKQDHYDWGLRAIKSVLVVAGTLKRDDHNRPEDQVLMRALRDFNIPKIVTDDVPIFMGLIGDLFPALDVPRKRILDFEKTIRRAVHEMKLQPEEGFLMKVVQLQELLDVRHSVFIVGNAGTGKTKIWQTLQETYRIKKMSPICNILNPKALSNDELFGIVNPTTREWKDGLFSSIMREQANMASKSPKWIILDGDIDPMWIESLNTLMDDNKILTLASNERISLKREMRLIFEVGHLKAATPATVSRAGILYINHQDLGWSPYILSWLETRPNIIERGMLTSLFEKYFPSVISQQRNFRRTIPIAEMAMIQMTCHLLDCLLDPNCEKISRSLTGPVNTSHNMHHTDMAPDAMESALELIFVYASMWSFGSALYQDHIVDWRREFHKWWISEFKDVKLPAQGTIFDYYLDTGSQKFHRWSEIAELQSFEPIDVEIPLQNILIPTHESVRLSYFLKLLLDRNIACMLVGNSGCGKGAIFRDLFSKYTNSDEVQEVPLTAHQNVGLQVTEHQALSAPAVTSVQTSFFNFYTSSETFQKTIDRPLEKKSGRCYAPSGPNRRMIYFVNDLNMPEVDTYGTVQPHTIMRQFMDYKQWYDRQRLQLKDIRRCQFVAGMNPTAGSFTIDPRLQRHFCVFCVSSPGDETLERIYGSILNSHLENPINGFSKEIRSISKLLVEVGIALHRRVEYAFLPTAIKFHYSFNLRDLTNIYQGVMNSIGTPNENSVITPSVNGVVCLRPADLMRLYVHEASRVYHDRLVDVYDIRSFKSSIRDIFKKDFEDFDEDFVFAEPLIYCHFAQSLVDQKYMSVASWDSLYQLLMEAQCNYNEIVGYMNLVMFEDAMVHVCRISRILESPRGNALLIGVGGSGKQTLARLASFISSMSVYQTQVKRGFSMADMKDEIATLYMKVGLKSVSSVFLMSDAQIPDESMLMLINDLLASGEIPELFSEDQLETIINGIRNEVKQSGTLDSKENCWKFFVEKVRRLMKIVLCFSPVGQTLRIRARKFPALISRTAIDWFHEWPTSALESVSRKFLRDIDDILPPNLIPPIAYFMAYVHGTVNEVSKIYLQNERRYNYTTPKTFLEYIFMYRKLLVEKYNEHTNRIDRLQSGMAKLAECARQVVTLKDQLAIQEVELTAKNAAADKLIVIVSAESEKVTAEKFIASEEEQRVRIIEEDVSIKTKICEEDLRKAEPALIAAQAALNTLNKNNLTELKSFGSPPSAVVNVCAAVMVLLATNAKIPRDRSWKAAKLMMVRVDQFLNDLVNYDKDNIHPNIIEVLQDYLKDPEFNPDTVVQKSVAAAGLCAWVINIHKYHQVFLIVGPKQKALQDSQEELNEARERLQYLKEKITELETKLSEIQAEFEEAVAEKQKCQREADKTAFTIDLAHRLVNGLANENIRWKDSVRSLQAKISTLPGDIVLISSFLSYAGCFTRRYREELQNKMWMPTFRQLEPGVPYTRRVDALTLFSNDAEIAAWNNEGLPMDRMSTENATILEHSTRWPLMIDPQLQGIKWIKNRFGESLVVMRLSQRNFIEVLEKSMSVGDIVLIEQMEETIDTVLEPLLSRALTKKGRYIRIGDKEMDFNGNFRLILHTKLANPHYKPEMQAQTTLINFTVTPDGLEEQLLAEVVKIERPDLEKMKTEVTVQQNKFKISLKLLEDDLLARLASAGENVLDDHDLVINLEKTKHTVDGIEVKVEEARITTTQIDETRNIYRSAANRAAILYFVLTDLSRINPIYKFSLKSFMHVFKQAITMAPQSETFDERVECLVNSITFQTFLYTLRGLFESDKLIFTSHMILRIMFSAEEVSKEEIDFLLRFSHEPNCLSPLDFVPRSAWGGVKSLSLMEHFFGLDKDMENYPKRWRKFLKYDTPEREQFPGEWKHRNPLQKLCIIRALRPDRIISAMRLFIEQTMGSTYAEVKNFFFSDIFKESNAATPIFFILSPGVDPIRDVEKLGQQLGFTVEAGTLLNISLGQGQEVVAEKAIKKALASGQHWVVLQNIHLVVNWLPTLEKLIERIAVESELNVNSNFRLFISAEPAPDRQCHIIPQGILESSLKIVNEPPSGMAANLHKAWDNFNQDTLETCTQEAEFKSILFALCYFHAVAGERRKFGSQGWNKVYPFNVGDLTISASVLHNYLEGSNRIPWEDLRYLFGEIMYGGHITDDWDRRLCQTYLEELLQQELVDGDFELCPGFPAPPNLEFHGYHSYITEMLPPESPVLYGLHPNAEEGFLTTASEQLLKTIFELQPRESELSTHCGAPREELVRIMIDDFLDKLQDEFNLQALVNRVERKTPFVVVALQECERMNALIFEIKRSLREVQLGLKGELTITQEMERLDHAIFYDHVPASWSHLAYPSLLGLQRWFTDLLHRIRELTSWLDDFKLPCSIWLGGLFNPQSFLTAIMQESARKHDLPLDRMCLSCDVTKKEKEDVTLPPMEGAFVHALFMDGASWDCQLNSIVPLHPKELLCSMPVIYVKSIVQEKQEIQRIYECPLYKTRSRGNTYVWTFNLKTRDRPGKWILGGVAMLLQP